MELFDDDELLEKQLDEMLGEMEEISFESVPVEKKEKKKEPSGPSVMFIDDDLAINFEVDIEEDEIEEESSVVKPNSEARLEDTSIINEFPEKKKQEPIVTNTELFNSLARTLDELENDELLDEPTYMSPPSLESDSQSVFVEVLDSDNDILENTVDEKKTLGLEDLNDDLSDEIELLKVHGTSFHHDYVEIDLFEEDSSDLDEYEDNSNSSIQNDSMVDGALEQLASEPQEAIHSDVYVENQSLLDLDNQILELEDLLSDDLIEEQSDYDTHVIQEINQESLDTLAATDQVLEKLEQSLEAVDSLTGGSQLEASLSLVEIEEEEIENLQVPFYPEELVQILNSGTIANNEIEDNHQPIDEVVQSSDLPEQNILDELEEEDLNEANAGFSDEVVDSEFSDQDTSSVLPEMPKISGEFWSRVEDEIIEETNDSILSYEFSSHEISAIEISSRLIYSLI